MKSFTASHIQAGYGAQSVIQNLSFSLDSGRILGILGANGSGKTTLIKSICGILPHQGSCTLNGVVLENLSPRMLARECSYIPQRSGISIDISALDVVLMGFNPYLKLLQQPDKNMKAQAREALTLVGLAGYEEFNYLHLSEGQKQLCILARTLVSGSSLLLLDEPESALDFRYRHKTLGIIRNWAKTGKRKAIVALHDPQLALNCCDELLLLKDGRSLGIIRPAEDSLPAMEALLKQIFGPLCLTLCRDKANKPHIVMLKEQEEYP